MAMVDAASHLHVLHAAHVLVDALDQRGVRGRVRQVGLQHVLCLHLQSLHLRALREVLLLGQVVQQVIDPLERVFNLHEVGLDILAVRDLGCAFSNGSPF